MKTAKIFVNGQSQAVRLPKEYRFAGEEVGITKVGEVVLLYPSGGKWESFLKAAPISDDVESAILEDRHNNYPSIVRETI